MKGIIKFGKYFVIGFSTVFLVASISVPVSAEMKLRVAGCCAADHWSSKALFHMADVAAKLSNNRLKIEVKHSSVLGSEVETLQLLRSGVLDMANVSAFKTSEFIPATNVFAASFVVNGWDHNAKIANNSRLMAEIERLEKASKPGFKLLYVAGGGSRNLYNSVRPVKKLADIRGLKMRTPGNPLITATWEALGATTVAVAWGELPTALQTGLLQAAENTMSGIVSYKLYEFAPNIARTAHLFDINSVLISDTTWAKLSDADRDVLHKAAAETAKFIIDNGRAIEAKMVKELKAEGCTVVDAPADIEKWVEKVKPVNVELAKKVGGEKLLEILANP